MTTLPFRAASNVVLDTRDATLRPLLSSGDRRLSNPRLSPRFLLGNYRGDIWMLDLQASASSPVMSKNSSPPL